MQRLDTAFHRCQVCAAPLPHAISVCGGCVLRHPPSAVSRCVAALEYQFPWDRLIGRWKFNGEVGWSTFWAAHMLTRPDAMDLWHSSDAVVPVPIGPARLAQRGYNQSWELVKALQRHDQGPAAALAQGLVRVRETVDQHSLPRAERLRNLQGAFAAHPQFASALTNAHVLLVDDVRTTGATLEAAAQALLQAGAARVSALVLARTPEPD